KETGADVPRLGSVTVTLRTPSSARSDAGTVAVSWVALPNVVARVVPPNTTCEELVKLVPVTVSAKPGSPSVPADLLRPVVVGARVWPVSENEALNVGGVVPPTTSLPTRSQSGARSSVRIQVCWSPGKSDPLAGFSADSHRKLPLLSFTCGTKKYWPADRSR